MIIIIEVQIESLLVEEDTFLWLSKGDLSGETENEITAQDQALRTKCHATEVLQTETDNKCRLCQPFDETVEHIIPACPILAKEQDLWHQRRRYE